MNSVSPASSVRFTPRTFSPENMAIYNLPNLHFGQAPRPVACGRGLVIGNRTTYPEINFTLGLLEINRENWPQIRESYQGTINDLCQRAVALGVPGLVVEFETLPDMTIVPGMGLEITELLAKTLADFHQKYGLKSALRLTPTDTRDMGRASDAGGKILRRSGKFWDGMQAIFSGAAAAGADLLAIESTGAKELADYFLPRADLKGLLFALGVLAPRDMKFLWGNIVDTCNQTNIIPSGDTACSPANTAMVMAEQKMLPRTLAALVRLMTITRSLVAYEMGAIGPGKDCAYENPFMKVIAGVPISMEGKAATAAHFSQLGNIPMAYADLWSNESIRMDVRLLAATGPVANLETLTYDCRLMNAALLQNQEIILRDLLVASDVFGDPQAYVLHPEKVLTLSKEILQGQTPFERTKIALWEGAKMIQEAVKSGDLKIPETETKLPGKYLTVAEALMEVREEELTAEMLANNQIKTRVPEFVPAEYDLE